MAVELSKPGGEAPPDTVELPAPTPWPIVTSGAVSVLGAILAIAGAVGWFRDVLPQEAQESVRVTTQVPGITTLRPEVARAETERGLPRVWLPVEIYPISAGIKGGLAGSVVMAALAMLYGIVSHTSIWYPVNLLAAGFFPEAATATTAQIAAFHLSALLIAVPIHLFVSLVVGLLYGATIPMLPRHPILLGGFIAPILWSGVIHSVLGIVNPVLDQRIDWFWFVLSQIGFGIVAGTVVSRQMRVPTWQNPQFGVRAGMEHFRRRDEDRGRDGRR